MKLFYDKNRYYNPLVLYLIIIQHIPFFKPQLSQVQHLGKRRKVLAIPMVPGIPISPCSDVCNYWLQQSTLSLRGVFLKKVQFCCIFIYQSSHAMPDIKLPCSFPADDYPSWAPRSIIRYLPLIIVYWCKQLSSSWLVGPTQHNFLLCYGGCYKYPLVLKEK